MITIYLGGMMFTSRSAVECYQDCPRYRYNQYFLLEKGVTRVAKSVPLVTGGAVHKGVEHLLNRVRIAAEPDIDTAVQLAVQQYVNDVEGVGFTGKGMQSDKQQWFTFNEQKALTEALIRAWYLSELPLLMQRYKILAVERDIVPIEIAPGIFFQAKIDAELQELQTGDYHNYSLKTCKNWNETMENSYKNDLQGITELWAVEEDAKRQNQKIKDVIKACIEFKEQQAFPEENLFKIAKYFNSKKLDKQVSGVRFCYLVKGTWKKPDYFGEDPDALKITYNPLIRGYKKITPSSVEYAHSWFYPNKENKSGKSTIGRGWEPFNVWETEMGVKGWMELLQTETIQPECGNVIKQQVVTPPEYFRDEAEVTLAMKEIVAQEVNIEAAIIHSMYTAYITTEGLRERKMVEVFPHYRKHCEFHFGGPCEYNELCWGDAKEDPIGSGLYQIRNPHQIYEREK
jgi:hypothetical protein